MTIQKSQHHSRRHGRDSDVLHRILPDILNPRRRNGLHTDLPIHRGHFIQYGDRGMRQALHGHENRLPKSQIRGDRRGIRGRYHRGLPDRHSIIYNTPRQNALNMGVRMAHGEGGHLHRHIDVPDNGYRE